MDDARARKRDLIGAQLRRVWESDIKQPPATVGVKNCNFFNIWNELLHYFPSALEARIFLCPLLRTQNNKPSQESSVKSYITTAKKVWRIAQAMPAQFPYFEIQYISMKEINNTEIDEVINEIQGRIVDEIQERL